MSEQQKFQPACELRARVTSLPTLRLNSVDQAAIVADVDSLIERAPGMLNGASVVIEPVDIAASALDLSALTNALRQSGVFPAALCSDEDAWKKLAAEAGLGILDAKQPSQVPASDRSAAEPKSTTPTKPGLIIEKPVRSGQQIYAQDQDLVVIGPVSAGAEVIADGNVHIYGPLRGRAIAGAKGHEDARIFCTQLAAELVAVAGCYCTNEQLPDDARGNAAQIWLAGDRLTVQALRS